MADTAAPIATPALPAPSQPITGPSGTQTSTGEPAAAPGAMSSITDALFGSPILILTFAFLGFYMFFTTRTQSQKNKKRVAMLAGLKRGDRVLTLSGIIGTVARLENDQEVQLDIAEGVRITLRRDAVTEVLTRTGNRDTKIESAKTEIGEGAKPLITRGSRNTRSANANNRNNPRTSSTGKTATIVSKLPDDTPTD